MIEDLPIEWPEIKNEEEAILLLLGLYTGQVILVKRGNRYVLSLRGARGKINQGNVKFAYANVKTRGISDIRKRWEIAKEILEKMPKKEKKRDWDAWFKKLKEQISASLGQVSVSEVQGTKKIESKAVPSHQE